MLPDRREAAGSSGTQPARRRPPYGFFKGFALGVVVVIPTVAATVWFLARLGIGDSTVSMVSAIRMTALFAGLAGCLTAGGIGRLAAFASMSPGGRRTAVIRAARAQAVSGAGLTLIAAIPLGQLPEEPVRWIWIGVTGLIGGAIDGVLIGAICGAPATERLPDFLRRVPVLAELARAAREDAERRRRERRRARRTDDTPLPAPVPLGDEASMPVRREPRGG
jgi:hypothetical protein